MLYIFDWDGTLIDSTGKIVRCLHEAIDEVSVRFLPNGDLREDLYFGVVRPWASPYNAGLWAHFQASSAKALR